MKCTCLLALLLACFLGVKGAIADDVADLKAIVGEIDSVESRREGATTSAAILARNVVRLTTMIDQRRMNASGMTVAYYYRALARSLQNAARLRRNEPQMVPAIFSSRLTTCCRLSSLTSPRCRANTE